MGSTEAACMVYIAHPQFGMPPKHPHHREFRGHARVRKIVARVSPPALYVYFQIKMIMLGNPDSAMAGLKYRAA